MKEMLSRSWAMTLHHNAQRKQRWEKEKVNEVKTKWFDNQPKIIQETLKKYV